MSVGQQQEELKVPRGTREAPPSQQQIYGAAAFRRAEKRNRLLLYLRVFFKGQIPSTHRLQGLKSDQKHAEFH